MERIMITREAKTKLYKAIENVSNLLQKSVENLLTIIDELDVYGEPSQEEQALERALTRIKELEYLQEQRTAVDENQKRLGNGGFHRSEAGFSPFTKAKIDAWIKTNSTGENYRPATYFTEPLLGKLCEAKTLIDRWDYLSGNIILHTSKRDFIREHLADKQDTNSFIVGRDFDSIWGMRIDYTDNCPVDCGIMIDLSCDEVANETIENKGSHIAVFPM